MKTSYLILIIAAVIALILGITWISCSNTEKRIRNQFVARQEANKATFDNMWKTISQAAQVTDAQKQALSEIFVQYAAARSGGKSGDDHAIVKWIQESVPHVDTSTFNNLQNIIVGTRASFTNDQLALLDLKRVHDNCLDLFPSSIVCGDRPRLSVKLVTSTRTDAAFDSGKDDNTDVFQKPAKVER